ncbi:hypothetical protein PSEUDO9AG_50673 [Pseudomonas sp. 9Ag]|nr:hypothetical protein PSEUDO9AG_50673 [Pseudomonas sp. 9Ag]
MLEDGCRWVMSQQGNMPTRRTTFGRGEGRRRDSAAGAKQVTLADEKDQYGLPIARLSWSMSDNYQRQDEYAVTSCAEDWKA